MRHQLLEGLPNYFFLAWLNLPLDHKKHFIICHVLGRMMLVKTVVPVYLGGHYGPPY